MSLVSILRGNASDRWNFLWIRDSFYGVVMFTLIMPGLGELGMVGLENFLKAD